MSGSGPELTCFHPSGELPGLPRGETAAGTEHRAGVVPAAEGSADPRPGRFLNPDSRWN